MNTTHRDARPPGRAPMATRSRWRSPCDNKASLQAIAGEVSAASRYLTGHGFEPTEAGNLTAYLLGLAPVETGWTVDEIERLMFVRHLVERRRIKS